MYRKVMAYTEEAEQKKGMIEQVRCILLPASFLALIRCRACAISCITNCRNITAY